MDRIKREEIVVSNVEKKFILNSIRENLRVDGRSNNDYRNIELEFLKNYGDVFLQIGKTKVYASTIGEVIKPNFDRPTEGLLFFRINLNEMGTQAFKDYMNKEEWRIEIEKIIDRSIRESKAIDLESLCISIGEYVWKLSVEIDVIDYCGNLIDASQIAALISLMHFRRKDVTINEKEEIIVHDFEEKNPVKLNLHHLPICISFAFFEENVFCVDPNLKEDLSSKSGLTVAMNDSKEICLIHKPGGIQVDVNVVLTCVKIASIKAKEITDYLKDEVEKDIGKRKNFFTPKYKIKKYFYNNEEIERTDIKELLKVINDSDSVSESDEDEDEDVVMIEKFGNKKPKTFEFDFTKRGKNDKVVNEDVEMKEKKKKKKKKKKRVIPTIKKTDDLTKAIINH